jgi:hypothetical protein
MQAEKRVLRHPVEVIESQSPLTEAEQVRARDLADRGLPEDQAERLIRRLRERQSIPAGTLVEIFPHAGADQQPDDSPTFLVRTPDGMIGITRLYNLGASRAPKPKSRRTREVVSLWRYDDM